MARFSPKRLTVHTVGLHTLLAVLRQEAPALTTATSSVQVFHAWRKKEYYLKPAGQRVEDQKATALRLKKRQFKQHMRLAMQRKDRCDCQEKRVQLGFPLSICCTIACVYYEGGMADDLLCRAGATDKEKPEDNSRSMYIVCPQSFSVLIRLFFRGQGCSFNT